MKCENGLKFTGIVCENIETAHEWLKQNNWVNPYSYEIVPVCFVTKEMEVK